MSVDELEADGEARISTHLDETEVTHIAGYRAGGCTFASFWSAPNRRQGTLRVLIAESEDRFST